MSHLIPDLHCLPCSLCLLPEEQGAWILSLQRSTGLQQAKTYCNEMKCITGVLVKKKIGQQLIVGKYGTSSICSARMIRENLTRLYHVFAETWNYRILFYSVSDYINQRKIVNQ